MEMNQVNLKARIYHWLPSYLQRPINSLRVVPTYLHWRVARDGWWNTQRVLAKYKNQFSGCRCVVIGNGPSLNNMDLSILQDEFTFGLNRIYLKFPELGFPTTFLVSVNRFVISQFGHEMMDARSFKFFNWKHSRELLAGESTDVVGLCANPWKPMDGRIIDGYYLGGGTVTNVAIELAYFLGFSEVVLIGVDHTYQKKGVPGKPIRSEARDPDHFSSSYFGKGVVWQLPNFPAMEHGYALARDLFESSGRTIVNATAGGNLEVFDRVPSLPKFLTASEKASRNEWVGKQIKDKDLLVHSH